MNSRQAKKLWEDTLINGTKGTAVKELHITQKEARVFMSYTMPEMFVDHEINRINLLKIKELNQKNQKISALLQDKQSSSLMLSIGLIFYITIVVPILALFTYIKYFA